MRLLPRLALLLLVTTSPGCVTPHVAGLIWNDPVTTEVAPVEVVDASLHAERGVLRLSVVYEDGAVRALSFATRRAAAGAALLPFARGEAPRRGWGEVALCAASGRPDDPEPLRVVRVPTRARSGAVVATVLPPDGGRPWFALLPRRREPSLILTALLVVAAVPLTLLVDLLVWASVAGLVGLARGGGR